MTTFGNLLLAFGMVIVIAGISSYIGIRKVLRSSPSIFSGANVIPKYNCFILVHA